MPYTFEYEYITKIRWSYIYRYALLRQPVFLARNHRRVGYRNLIPHKKYQTKPKPLRYKADVYSSPVTMGIYIISPVIKGIPQVPKQGHTTVPLLWAFIPQVPLPRAYHSPVIKGIPQVPLPWAYHKSRYHGHTTVPLSRAYHKSRYYGHLYHKSRNKGIPQVSLPWVYHIEYRYSSCFFYVVFYRFNKAGTIIIIMEYGAYGLASGVIGECCFTAPSATRI